MTVLANSFEGGANGVALTIGNTGGDSGYPAGLIVGSPTFDSAQSVSGGRSMLIAADSVAQQFRWTGLSLTSLKARCYVRLAGLNGVDNYPLVVAVGGTRVVILNINGANKLRLYTAAGTGSTIWTAANAFSAGTWYRLELFVSGLSASAATVKVAYFALHDTVPIDAYDGTGVSNTGLSNFDNVMYGKQNAAVLTQDLHVDDIALDLSPDADYVWPSQTPAPPFNAAVPINRRRP